MKWFKKLSRARFANPSSNHQKIINKKLLCLPNNKLVVSPSSDCDKKSNILQNGVVGNVRPAASAPISLPTTVIVASSSSATDNQYYFYRDSVCCCSIDEGQCCCCNNNSLEHDLQCRNLRHDQQMIAENLNHITGDLLAEQARKLEELIRLNSISAVYHDRTIVDPDDFFEDPVEVSQYREEMSFFSEWEIIDDIPSSLSTQHGCLSTSSVNEIDHTNDQFFSCQSEIVADESNYQTFEGEFRLRRNLEKLLTVSGESSSDQVNSIEVIENYKNRNVDPKQWEQEFSKGRELGKTSSETNAIARSLMGPLIKEVSFCPLFNSSFDDKAKKLVHDKKSPNFSIQKYFGLNDHGDIIIHIDHIVEYSGFGYLAKKNHSVKSIPVAVEVTEKSKFNKNQSVSWNRILDILFDNNDSGHPRNKLTTGGPGDSIGAYTLSLAADQSSTFAQNIENFISCTKDSRELAPHVVMRNMRQFMSGMKNYLVKHGEGNFQREVERARSRLKSDEFLNLDTILEGVMHRLVVLPLREHLYGLFVDYYKRSGDIQLLVDNIKYACQRSAVEIGIQPCVTPPSVSALQKISSILVKLQEAELPLDKLEFLLAAVSVLFESTGSSRGQQFGADEFLPLLVLVVAKTGFYSAEIEAEFMYGLLHPSLLSGEAGYYLTALCSAVHVLKSFMSSENEGTGSLDWRSSSLPASSSVLRVIIPDEYNGSLQTRTLPVRPHTTTKEVCRTIAHKARITNPQDYGLFKLVDGEETLLLENECPQDVRISARGKHCILAYKRIDAKIAWPTQQPSIF